MTRRLFSLAQRTDSAPSFQKENWYLQEEYWYLQEEYWYLQEEYWYLQEEYWIEVVVLDSGSVSLASVYAAVTVEFFFRFWPPPLQFMIENDIQYHIISN